MQTYEISAIITYIEGRGYKVSVNAPCRRICIYTAQTFSGSLKAVARELKDVIRDLDAYAKALDDTGSSEANTKKGS